MVLLDACFWVVCLVLVASGATKVLEPLPFARALRQLGLGGALAPLARVVGVLEVVGGIAGLAVGGRWIAGAVAVAYVTFTAVVLLARARGLDSCGCFGERSGPPSVGHAVLNAVSALVAGAGVVRAPKAVADGLAGRSGWAALLVLGVLVVTCAVLVVDTRSSGTTVPSTTPSSRGTDGRR